MFLAVVVLCLFNRLYVKRCARSIDIRVTTNNNKLLESAARTRATIMASEEYEEPPMYVRKSAQETRDADGLLEQTCKATVSGDERLKQLYPMVDENETPLPRSWNAKDKFANLGLSQNNMRVHYKGTTSVSSRSFRFPFGGGRANRIHVVVVFLCVCV